MKRTIASASAVAFLLASFSLSVVAEDKAAPQKGESKTPQEKCLARSAKVLEACKAECAKDLNTQVRCDKNCSQKNDEREKVCKQPT